MGAAFGYDWVYAAAGWVLGVAGVSLLFWALLWDRSRGRRRCPGCWYEMAGVAGLRCPECGREAKSEKRLGKTRGRWGWSLAAVPLLLGATVVWGTMAYRRRGLGVIPDVVLAAVAPVRGSPFLDPQAPPSAMAALTGVESDLQAELAKRCAERDLSPLGWKVLMPRLVRSDPSLAPGLLTVRAAEVSGYPLYVAASRPVLWYDSRIAMRARVRGGAWVACPILAFRYEYGEPVSLGVAPAGVREVDVEVEVRMLGPDAPPSEDPISAGMVIWRGHSHRVPIVADVAESMRPVASAEYGGVLQRAFAGSIGRDETGRVRLGWPLLTELRYSGLTFGLRVQIVSGDLVLAGGNMLYRRPSNGYSPQVEPEGWESHVALAWDVRAMEQAKTAGAAWELRIAGDPAVALRDLGSDAYWAGEVSVPIEAEGTPSEGEP